MRKLRNLPYLTQFCLGLLLLLAVAAAVVYQVSSTLSRSVFTNGDRLEVERAIALGEERLADYAEGRISQEELRKALNPELNPGGIFVMLLDADGKVIAFSDVGVPYFGVNRLRRYVSRLRDGAALSLSVHDTGGLALIGGRRTESGFVLAGKPMRVFSGTLTNYRGRLITWLLLSLVLFAALTLLLSHVADRPMRRLKTAAREVEQGKVVRLDEGMPGEIGDVARAFNHMSAQVSATIGDLNREKETMRLLLEGILALDMSGAVLHKNPAFSRLLGEDDTPYAQEVAGALRRALNGDLTGGRVSRGEMVLQYDITRLPRDSGVLAVVQDVTEAERLNRTRYDYVANISHELRTPLANMRGLAEGLRDGLVTDEDERMRYYGIIVDEVRRLSRLVNDLLELSGLQSNPAAFEMERVAPTEVLWELFDLNKRAFSEKRQALVLDVPEEDLPEIITNEDRLSEVLTILLDNARKYTPEGGHITLGAQTALTDGIVTGVRFFVRDDGIGMDEDTQRLAFDRFHQADKSHAAKGSGLGLAIAREILLKLGVEIKVKSKLGEGSEFSFELAVP